MVVLVVLVVVELCRYAARTRPAMRLLSKVEVLAKLCGTAVLIRQFPDPAPKAAPLLYENPSHPIVEPDTTVE